MSIYDQYMQSFEGEGLRQPVIILVDDDKGSNNIKKAIKIDNFSEKFYHLSKNLYVVPIPKIGSRKETKIEDLFYKKTLVTKINNKCFNPSKNIDINTEYGKIVFAEKVIKANQQKINFTRFKEVFDRFNLVIEQHST